MKYNQSLSKVAEASIIDELIHSGAHNDISNVLNDSDQISVALSRIWKLRHKS